MTIAKVSAMQKIIYCIHCSEYNVAIIRIMLSVNGGARNKCRKLPASRCRRMKVQKRITALITTFFTFPFRFFISYFLLLCFVTLTISFMQHNFHYLITIKPHTNSAAEKKFARRGNGFRLKLKMRHSHDLLTIARSRMWNCNCKTPALFNYDIFKRRTIAR